MGDEDTQDEGTTDTTVTTPGGPEVSEQTPAPDAAPENGDDSGDGDASST